MPGVRLTKLPGEALVDRARTDELEVGLGRQPSLDLGKEAIEVLDPASLSGALRVAGAAMPHRRVMPDVPARAGVRRDVGRQPLELDDVTATSSDPRLAAVDPDDDPIPNELRRAAAGSAPHEFAHAGRSSNRSARAA